jgi:hypothetical protein
MQGSTLKNDRNMKGAPFLLDRFLLRLIGLACIDNLDRIRGYLFQHWLPIGQRTSRTLAERSKAISIDIMRLSRFRGMRNTPQLAAYVLGGFAP